MASLRILCQDYPQRTIALATTEFALIFQHSPAESVINPEKHANDHARCLVEFASLSSIDLKSYRVLGYGYGTLGLVNLNEDVFLCVITGSSKAAAVRPGETVSRIDNVDFFCLNHSDYEYGLENESESSYSAEELGRGAGLESRESVAEHPFLALKKLLSDGSFYYSLDFNLTDRLQDRSEKSAAFDIDSLDEDMLWNSYMINPLLLFRNHLPPLEKLHLDSSQILTCVIRGYCSTLTIPASVLGLPQVQTHFPSTLTVISRQSSRRAGTRFNSRGIDDDGNVANFVETETILWAPPGIAFSYAQVRGSVPIFWEQAPGFLPGQQKIEVTRSSEATQHAFDKHFEFLELEYGAIHVVNLLSELRPGEAELSARYRGLIRRTPLNQKASFDASSDHALLQMTDFDFHAETRGPLGYEASSQIKPEIVHSLDGFAYFLSEETSSVDERQNGPKSSSIILQQEGVFRTNCLDCLDRTNLVQTIISSMALESFLLPRGGRLSSEFLMRHSTLWADNGDALSKIYAGTGALKSSFTRHGKMSLAGALADARKTATRLYVSNFSDNARQQTIDLLLGRLTNQIPVTLYDPINDMVSEELSQRAPEYSFTKPIKIWTGTFNVNGRHQGPDIDLTPWLFPTLNQQSEDPTIFAIGFQEIVELSPQQIMSTDPSTRKVWEVAVKNCLNKRAEAMGTARYVLLRSGQLVGAALMIYVKEEVLDEIKNVEGSVKKTGLSGVAGNKGGCAIRFEYSNTRICFVTAHLAAGFANYDERNRDYETIYHGLRFQRNRSIEDHDTIIWLGDFNYRIGLSNQNVRELVIQKDYQKLYDNDQLNLQMMAGRAFQFYTEGLITFPPTYKYDIGTDDYDTSEKARIPAWCDRVLWKGSNLQQMYYNSSDLRFSDHRPVWSIFSCMINVVDEGLKSKLRRLLYGETQESVHDNPANVIKEDDGDLLSFGSIASGLPPASSDHQKWWLDDGAPVKSTVGPPADGLILNIHRRSNPFSPNSDADWVSAVEPIDQQRDTRSNINITQKPPLPPRGEIQANTLRTAETSDIISTSAKTVGDMKVAPPVPRKPIALSNYKASSVSTTPQPSTSTPKSSTEGDSLAQGVSPKAQGLPKFNRSADKAGNLLDDISDEGIDWKPLVPQ